MDDTQKILLERSKTHGDYRQTAKTIQEIKTTLRVQPNWANLNPQQREALEMISHKIGRILAGNPNVKDHWVDIAGYATLVANLLGDTNESE